MFIRICCLGGDACLLSGNPKMNLKETENQNPESSNQKKQALQIRENYCAELLPLKIREPIKKSSNKNSLSFEICATVISSEGCDYENLNKVRHK